MSVAVFTHVFYQRRFTQSFMSPATSTFSFLTAAVFTCEQLQVGGKKTSLILQKLQPDTPYTVSVAAVYPTGVSADISQDGKTSKSESWTPLLFLLFSKKKGRKEGEE